VLVASGEEIIMPLRSYKDLKVWQKSIDLIDEVYRLTRNFPKSETYGLSSQMQRASVSVAANIAEGSGRDSTKEFIHHLAYALGSLAEVETYLTLSVRLNYAAKTTIAELESKCDEIGKMLRSLQSSLKKRLNEKTSH
jgi:four helix bundle protein